MPKGNREMEKIFSDGRKNFGESLSIRSDTAHKILSGVRIWHHYCPAHGPVGYDSVVTISLTPWKLNSLKGKYRTFFSFRSLKTIQFHHF